MGRKNKSYAKTLHQQAYDRLNKMLHVGESKKAAVADGTADEKIFSFSTYKSILNTSCSTSRRIIRSAPRSALRRSM